MQGLWRKGLWLAAIGLLTLVACSPALNWRETRIAQLRAWLPCKPDHATRTVTVGDQLVEMEMQGCEANGALYAVSHITVAPDQAVRLQMAWRKAALAQMQAGEVKEHPWSPPVSASTRQAATLSAPAMQLRTQGKRADGSAVQAQLAWFGAEGQLYHLVVYASQLPPEFTEPFTEQLQLP